MNAKTYAVRQGDDANEWHVVDEENGVADTFSTEQAAQDAADAMNRVRR